MSGNWTMLPRKAEAQVVFFVLLEPNFKKKLWANDIIRWKVGEPRAGGTAGIAFSFQACDRSAVVWPYEICDELEAHAEIGQLQIQLAILK